jgi:hypothetical protein
MKVMIGNVRHLQLAVRPMVMAAAGGAAVMRLAMEVSSSEGRPERRKNGPPYAHRGLSANAASSNADGLGRA